MDGKLAVPLGRALFGSATTCCSFGGAFDAVGGGVWATMGKVKGSLGATG